MTKSRFFLPFQTKYVGLSRRRPFSFDLDLPADCDDEYWTVTDGRIPFKQPAGIPSTIAFFNLSHRLNQIASFAMRTIVSF